MSDQISPLADELRQAAGQMTSRERALGDALMDLAGEVHAVAEMLVVLADSDAALAPLLEPLIYSLRSAGTRAVGVHAAVVADINQPDVH
jgi:hypothetical protein